MVSHPCKLYFAATPGPKVIVRPLGSCYHLAMQPAVFKKLPENVELMIVASLGDLREDVSSEELTKYLPDAVICETLQ